MILDLIDAYRITKDFMNVLVFFFRYNHLNRLQLYFAFYLSFFFQWQRSVLVVARVTTVFTKSPTRKMFNCLICQINPWYHNFSWVSSNFSKITRKGLAVFYAFYYSLENTLEEASVIGKEPTRTDVTNLDYWPISFRFHLLLFRHKLDLYFFIIGARTRYTTIS